MNIVQVLYLVISLVITVGILIGSYFIKKQKHKDMFLMIWAISTFVIHISVMWVDFLQNGEANAPSSVLFPIYFCNACMYLLMAVSLIKDKKSKVFNYLATFVAYAGTFGGIITIVVSEFFEGPNIVYSWGNIKSMLSHSTMIVGCLYLFVGGYVKIRVKNLIPYIAGLVGCGVLGLLVTWMFVGSGLDNPNAMYLFEPALAGVEFTKGYYIALIMLAIITVLTATWEFFALKKEDRWYSKIKAQIKSKKTKVCK